VGTQGDGGSRHHIRLPPSYFLLTGPRTYMRSAA
jgi:hypothetical protein